MDWCMWLCLYMCISHIFMVACSLVRTHIFLLQVNNVSFVTSSHVIRSHCERLSRLHPLVSYDNSDDDDDETLLVYVWAYTCMCMYVCLFLLLCIFFYDSSWTYTKIIRAQSTTATLYTFAKKNSHFRWCCCRRCRRRRRCLQIHFGYTHSTLTYHLIDLH